MRDTIIIFSFFLSIIMFPLQLHAREAETLDGKENYFYNKYPTPATIYDESKNKTEQIIEDALKHILNFKSSITGTPDQINPANPTETPSSQISISPGQVYGDCPTNGAIQTAGTKYKHLNKSLPCDKPRMIVIHWSAGWSTAQATFNTLNDRDRSCQFAVDENETLQMLNMYSSSSGPLERGWCAGGDSNVGSINFEITGAYFDEVLENPNSRKYENLIIMTDKTVSLTCQFIQMYGIPKNAIYGHYQLQSGKSDPGKKYLQFFKNKVNQKC